MEHNPFIYEARGNTLIITMPREIDHHNCLHMKRDTDLLLEEKTGINCMIAEDPLTAVAIGTGKCIEYSHGNKKNMEE